MAIVLFTDFGSQDPYVGQVKAVLELVAGGCHLSHARVFSAAPEGEAFWCENSQGLVEIAMNLASAAENLQLKAGSPVAWAS